MTHTESDVKGPYYLGFDGGGTKTDCVLIDANGAMLARATAGPSNPLRAGYAKAWFTLSDAADIVLERQRIKTTDIRGVCAGIGGAGRESVARRMANFLERTFPEATVEVITDLEITLEAAVGDRAGMILIVGTGSGAYGRDDHGRTARAGGRGPWFSDEGSAFDIGRRALGAVVRAEENRGPATELSQKVLEWLGSRDWAHVLDWVAKNPDDVFPRVFPLVARLGDHGDAVSQQILSSAAASLGDLAACVLDSLGARERVLPIAKAGGTVGRSRYFDAAIDAALTRVAPRANVVALEKKPAEAAAHRARRAGHSQAHGG